MRKFSGWPAKHNAAETTNNGEEIAMFVSYYGLFMIVLSSMFVGCCVGVVVMAMCKVSAANNYSEEETP